MKQTDIVVRLDVYKVYPPKASPKTTRGAIGVAVAEVAGAKWLRLQSGLTRYSRSQPDSICVDLCKSVVQRYESGGGAVGTPRPT